MVNSVADKRFVSQFVALPPPSENKLIFPLEGLLSSLRGLVIAEAKIYPLYPHPINNDSRKPLYRAVEHPATPGTQFFPENTVPLSSMVLPTIKNVDPAERNFWSSGGINSQRKNGFSDFEILKLLAEEGIYVNSLNPSVIAQAAIKANPDIQLIVATSKAFNSINDPVFIQERKRIGKELGISPEQVFPVRAVLPKWPQDEFMAGTTGLIKSTYRSYYPQQTENGTGHLARELGLGYYKAPFIGRGGDTQIVQAPDGQLKAFFSWETIEFAREAMKMDGKDGFVLSLAFVMHSLNKSGVAMENIAPLGTSASGVTYGDVLKILPAETRAKIDPLVLKRFEQMANLPFPDKPFAYHTDLIAFTPNGKDMFIPASRPIDNTVGSGGRSLQIPSNTDALSRQLKFFGYTVHTMPTAVIQGDTKNIYYDKNSASPTINPDKQHLLPQLEGTELLVTGRVETTYLNMVSGKDPKTGQQVILMPTQALKPDQLTAADKVALATIKNAVPDARIIPIGGHSAFLGDAYFFRKGSGHFVSFTKGDWGTHCMTNVLPYIIKLRTP